MRSLHEASSNVRPRSTKGDRLTPSNLNKENHTRTFQSLFHTYIDDVKIEPDQMGKRAHSKGHLFQERDMNNTSLQQRMKDQVLTDLALNM